MRLVLLLVLTVVPAAAQRAPDDRRPPLFVIEDADSRVYLLGSVHALPAGALPLPGHVEAAYADASVVAFEIDLDQAEASAPAMLAAATDESSVLDALTDKERRAVEAAVVALGLPASSFHTFEPWFAALTFGVVSLQTTDPSVEPGGVDAHYFERAGADGKERLALETVALQVAALDDLSTKAQVAFLMETVATAPDSSAAQFGVLIDAWAAGDDDRLGALMNDGFTLPEVYDALLVRRNRAWVPQIEALLGRDGENALVVVGAGHLVGPESVVAMLRAAGHEVTRL